MGKKVLVVVTTFPSVSETFILNQITDLIDRGYEVTIFSYNKPTEDSKHPLFFTYNLENKIFYHFKNEDKPFKSYFLFLKFIVINFYKINLKNSSLSLQKWKALYDMPIFLLQQNFDIVHCHFGFNGRKVANLKKLNIISNAKCVLTFHGSDLTPSWIERYKELYNDVFKYFDAFTVNSPYLETIVKQINPNVNNLEVLPVGFKKTELEKITLVPKKVNPIHLVFCGRLIPIKGPEKAVLILKELRSRGYNVHLNIIGDGPMKNELVHLVEANELDNYIILHGNLKQDKVFNIFSYSSVFIMSSSIEKETFRAETQGLVIQEAQFFKLPVVASNIGGIKFGLIDKETGFLVDENDIPSFVDKISLLIDNEALRLEMGEKGHHYVKNRFDSIILGVKLNDIFENILSNN